MRSLGRGGAKANLMTQRTDDPTDPRDCTPLVVVVSGPSGVGKDTLLERMADRFKSLRFHFVVTATTRPARPGEIEGVNHHFLTRTDFESMIERGELLEWAEVYGNLYGVPRRQVRSALEEGLHVLCRVDVQGAARLRKMIPEAVFVFVLPPSLEALGRRLRYRAHDSDESIARRLKAARSEMDRRHAFDYQLVNEDEQLDQSVDRLVDIIGREARRDPPRRIEV